MTICARPRRDGDTFACRVAHSEKPQQQYQKRLPRPEVQKRLSPQLRWILALDDARNDELSANVERTSGFLK